MASCFSFLFFSLLFFFVLPSCVLFRTASVTMVSTEDTRRTWVKVQCRVPRMAHLVQRDFQRVVLLHSCTLSSIAKNRLMPSFPRACALCRVRDRPVSTDRASTYMCCCQVEPSHGDILSLAWLPLMTMVEVKYCYRSPVKCWSQTAWNASGMYGGFQGSSA